MNIAAFTEVSTARGAGDVTQEVVVSAETEVLNVREASISALITSTELREIPLNDKQYVNFIRLEPGQVSRAEWKHPPSEHSFSPL